MNILIPDSWLREYLDTNAQPKDIQRCLSLCGPSVETIKKIKDDYVYDIEITPNRIDMVSVYGIAREAAAILPRFGFKTSLKALKIIQEPKPYLELPMKISDPAKLCNRILGIVMEVDKMKPSPKLIRDRLENSGVRSLNNLVDITNYVMLEVGHPCHVFDYDRIKTHRLLIRYAKKGEEIITLDKKKYHLDDSDVIIDDDTGRVIDLPGIMGTENSVVTTSTRRILFFIESNNPTLIRKTSIRYGIRTMAASINEKRPDSNLPRIALFRGIELYQKLAGGKTVSRVIDIYPSPSAPKTITVGTDFINSRLGIELPVLDIEKILASLGFTVRPAKENVLKVTPPSFRQFDIVIPEDIVEEVARIYGYHNLPAKIMTGRIPVNDKPLDLSVESKIKNLLKAFGFIEVYNYSLVSKSLLEKATLNPDKHLRLINPLTMDFEYLRTSLIPSLLQNISDNQSRNDLLQFFELSKIYLPKSSDLPEEISILALITTKGFYELKGIIEAVFPEIGVKNYHFQQVEVSNYFGMETVYSINIGNKAVGNIGKLKRNLAANFGFKIPVYLAEINVGQLLPFIDSTKQYKPISIYPDIIEDLSLIIPERTKIGPVLENIYKIDSLVKNVSIVDRYEKSITFRIAYHDNHQTLSGEETQKIRKKILALLKEKYSIILKS